MSKISGYTTVDRIFAKNYRELKDTDFDEDDVLEWIGEALDFLNVQEVQEQAVAILEVKNHETFLPDGFQTVLQLALINMDQNEDCEKIIKTYNHEDLPRLDATLIKEDDCNQSCYKPYFDMQIQFIDWYKSPFYTIYCKPIRLSNHSLFNTLVCKEKRLYETCGEEYTIVGTIERKLRFSFKEGTVALSYNRAAIDIETGYPLVPDNISYITAISYYIKWKIAERYSWERKEGFDGLADRAESHWLKYAKQAKNFAKMPKTIDEYQNLLEQTHNLIPNHKKYYNYFGTLGRRDKVKFNDPHYRNKY